MVFTTPMNGPGFLMKLLSSVLIIFAGVILVSVSTLANPLPQATSSASIFGYVLTIIGISGWFLAYFNLFESTEATSKQPYDSTNLN